MNRGKRMARRQRGKADLAPANHSPGAPGRRQIDIANRQRTRRVNVSMLRKLFCTLLRDLLKIENATIDVALVAAPDMTRLNETFLNHEGSTDVITFDYSDLPVSPARIRGEIFICVDQAVLQARRFRTTWQAELVRYLIHGTLHLLGYDDHRAADRLTMKREENRLLRLLAARFPLSHLAPKPRLCP